MNINKNISQHKQSPVVMDDVLVNVARGVANAQRQLEKTNIDMQHQLKKEGLDHLGIRPEQYIIPSVGVTLKTVFDIDYNNDLTMQMVDGEYVSKYGFNLKAASTVNAKIISTPPATLNGLSIMSKRDVILLIGRIKPVVQIFESMHVPAFSVIFESFSDQGYDGGVWIVTITDHPVEGGAYLRIVALVDDMSGTLLRLIMNPKINEN